MRTPRPIDEGISSVIRELGLGGKLKQFQVLEAWPEIVGAGIAEIATAEAIRDGKLFVSVSRPTWRNELIFLKRELIEKINRAMKGEIVKDIIFR
jgi:predicted nucleic acid-binding Zn ribbon protein